MVMVTAHYLDEFNTVEIVDLLIETRLNNYNSMTYHFLNLKGMSFCNYFYIIPFLLSCIIKETICHRIEGVTLTLILVKVHKHTKKKN